MFAQVSKDAERDEEYFAKQNQGMKPVSLQQSDRQGALYAK